MREVVFSLLSVALLCATSESQTTEQLAKAIPEELTLGKALEILRERNPILLAERQREAAAAGELEQVRKLPNPLFSLETESFDTVQGEPAAEEIFLSLQQPILMAGKRSKRAEVAGALVRAARNDLRSFERDLSYQLKAVFSLLVLAQSDLELANQILGDFDRVVQLSRIRYERGEMAGGELRRIETEKLRFLEDQVAAEISLESARAELLGLLGMPEYGGVFRVAAPARFEGDIGDVETLAREAIESRPEVTAQLARQEAALRDVDLQKAMGVPDVLPFVGYQRQRDPVLGARTSFVNFGVTVGLPLFDRNQGGLSRARADLRREEELDRAIRQQVTVEVRQARESYLLQRKRLTFFEETYLRTARQARDIAEAAYRMGGETLINFLDASRVYRETLQAYNRAVRDESVARFALERALGKELS
jgi:cobalt-zinc-cadmium efflux system outer membrane protein